MVSWQVYEAGQRGKPEIGRIANKKSKTEYFWDVEEEFGLRGNLPDVRLSHLIQASPSSHRDPKWMKLMLWMIAKRNMRGGLFYSLYSKQQKGVEPAVFNDFTVFDPSTAEDSTNAIGKD